MHFVNHQQQQQFPSPIVGAEFSMRSALATDDAGTLSQVDIIRKQKREVPLFSLLRWCLASKSKK
jgi:hypothetical protein